MPTAKTVPGKLLTPGIWCIGVALGCTLAWPLMAFQSQGLYIAFPNSEQLLDFTYFLSITATVVTFGVCAALHKPLRNVLGTAPATVALPAGIAASTLLVLGCGASGAAGQTFAAAFGVLTGVFTALFLMTFGAVLPMLSLKQSAAAIAIAYVASTALFFLFLFFAHLEATIFCASMGPVAALFLYFGVSWLGLQKNQARDPLPEQQALPDDAAERRDLRTLVVAFSLCMLVAGVAYELSRTLYVQMGSYAQGGVAPYAIMQGAATSITVLGSVGASIALISARSVRGPETCYRLILFFLMLGVLLLPLPLVFPDLPAFVPLAINVGSFQCLGLGMWVLLAGVLRQHRTCSLFAFACVRAAWAAGPLVGMLLGRWLWYGTGFGVQQAFVVSVVCAMLVAAVGNFIFTERVLAKALNMMPTERKQRFQERCRAVIERYGLTEREGEIMVMFAKGRNLPYVQEELCLSKSTVSTHRQHIYQKLGVHSAQEMIDLIQAEKG